MKKAEPQTYATRKTTVWVILVTIALLIAWDIYAATSPAGSISEVMLGWSQKYPVVPFLFGVLCGHLFVPQVPVPSKP
jgi:uncharacterized integral membrane protein